MTDQPGSDARTPIKTQLAQQLQDRLRKYREQRDRLKACSQSDPEAPAREKRQNREIVTAEIQTLTELWREVMPYIRRIKTLAGDVLDHTRYSACYFLFGKVSNGLEAIFVLAQEGFHYEVMEIIRSNREALDLIVLLLQEPPDSPLLKRWFEGEIIENAKARDAFESIFADTARAHNITLSPRALKSDIYSSLSRYSHVSFAALLDAYDVYRHDFDFDRVAGYHYVRGSSLPYLREEIRSATLTLRFFYLSIPDVASYHALFAISRKYGFDMPEDEKD